ncbi:MAG: hypothetical protein IT518_14750 [Burkholderiales bacterium]|nr:hypothetical protein [Burkholderiales bacterium]
MSDLNFTLRLIADGSGFSGTLRAAQDDVTNLGDSARKAASGTADLNSALGGAATSTSTMRDAMRGASGSTDDLKSAMRDAVIQGNLIGDAIKFAAGKVWDWVQASIAMGDELRNMSIGTGKSIGDLQALGSIAEKNGTTLGAMTGTLDFVAKGMSKASDETGRNARALDFFGVSLTDASGKAKSAEQVAYELAVAYTESEKTASTAAAAQVALGGNYAKMIPSLLELSGKQDELNKLRSYGAVVDDDLAKASSDYNASLVDAQSVVTGVGNDLARILLPAMKGTVDLFVTSAADGGVLKGVLSELGVVVDVLVGTFKVALSALIGFDSVVQMAGKSVGALLAIIDRPLSAATIWSEYKADIASISEKSAKAINDLWQEIDKTTASTKNAADEGKKLIDRGGFFGGRVPKERDDVKEARTEVDKFVDAMKAAQAADETGLAKNTIRQMELLEQALKTGKISRDQYNTWVDLILDKDPVLAKEQEAINKALKEGTDALAKLNEGWKKEERSLDDRIQKQRDANTAVGLGQAALIDLELAHVNEKLAVERSGNEYSDYTVHLENTRDKLIALRDATIAGEQLEANKKALEAQSKAWEQYAKEWQQYIDEVADYASDFITTGINDGWRAAFRNLWDDFKAWGIKAIADIAAQKLIVPLIGAVGGLGSSSASAGGFGLGDLASAGSSMWNAFSGGTSSMVGNFAMSGVGQSLGLSTSLVGQAGSLSLGVETAGAAAGAGSLTGVGSALMTAAPYAAIAAVALPVIMSLFKSGGGPKEGGFAASGETPGISGTDNSGRWFTPSGSDAAMLSSVGGMNTSYQSLLALLGGTGSATFAQGFSTDPKGTAASNVHSGVWVGGVQVGNFENPNVGRTDEALSAELQTQSMRAVLAALQASDLPEIVAGYLASIDVSTATVEQINAALAHAADLKVLVDQVSALPADMARGLLAALGVSDEIDAQIAAFAASFAAFSVAVDSLQSALDRDPQAEALKAYAAANTTLYDKVGLARDSLTDLVSQYDGSTGATNDLAAATNAYRNAQVAVLVQIESLKTSLGTMFGDSIRQLDMAILDAGQRGDFLKNEAEKTIGLLQQTTDPAEIDKFAKLINKDLVDAFNILSPEEQKIQHDAFVKRLEETDDLVQQRLEASRQEIGDDNANAQVVLGSIRAAMDVAAEKQQEAAQALIDGAQAVKDAAAVIAAAAETSKVAADTQAGAANMQQGAATTFQTAANTPITVWVQESVNP